MNRNEDLKTTLRKNVLDNWEKIIERIINNPFSIIIKRNALGKKITSLLIEILLIRKNFIMYRKIYCFPKMSKKFFPAIDYLCA